MPSAYIARGETFVKIQSAPRRFGSAYNSYLTRNLYNAPKNLISRVWPSGVNKKRSCLAGRPPTEEEIPYETCRFSLRNFVRRLSIDAPLAIIFFRDKPPNSMVDLDVGLLAGARMFVRLRGRPSSSKMTLVESRNKVIIQ